jgi:hypothetical protein
MHPHLQEVYVLIDTNNMLPLSWQATPFAPFLPQAFGRVASS